jgi:hypothetical protein
MDKTPVSERALAQRIDRKLRKDGEMLRKGRGRWASELGYYIIDVNRNLLLAQNLDLESLGREMDVLGKWEKVVRAE